MVKESRAFAVKAGVKAFPTTFLFLLSLLSIGCVHQQVVESVDEHVIIEGKRYAAEVEAQSPFEPVEISWRQAEDLMRKRNPTYRAAQANHAKALEETPLVEELTEQVKDVAGISFGDLLKPDKLALSLQAPVTQLPKQLASVSKLKNLSHQIEQDTWEKMVQSVTTEMMMREQEVKLQRLLRTGGLIDHEMAFVRSAPQSSQEPDPKFADARKKWCQRLDKDRDAWLKEVRDFFDAEYYDVVFRKDDSGLPTYEGNDNPDLAEWNRWCRLSRSRELVGVLREAHKKSKPTVPGTALVTGKLGGMLNMDLGKDEALREPASVRAEVRKLIRSWREMKEAQTKAGQLEAEGPPDEINNVAEIGKRQTIYELRRREIQHASVVWMMDESCWSH